MSYGIDKLRIRSFCQGVNVKVSRDFVITYSIDHRILKRIELDYNNYFYHITRKHREITLVKIIEILNEPDYIFKASKNRNNEYFFEKSIDGKNFRVVVVRRDKNKTIKTAYIVENETDFTRKHNYCSYDRKAVESTRKEEILRKKEEDRYFKEAFNIM